MSNTPSTKQFILTVLDYSKELLRKWYVYLFFIAIFCGLMFFYLASKDVTYAARLTFMTNNNNKSGLSGLMQLAGSFGFGTKSNTETTPEKLAEILVSDLMLKTTFFTNAAVTIDNANSTDLLINHYYKIYKPKEFEPQQLTIKEAYSSNENFLINEAVRDIKDILSVNISDNGIVRLTANTKNEFFSQQYCIKLFDALNTYFTTKSIVKQQETYDVFNSRKDSLNNLLLTKEAELKFWLNKFALRIKNNSLTPDEYLTKVRLERETEVISNIYKEALQATEVAKMELETAKPVIQVIDTPVLPLKMLYAVPIIFYGVAIIAALMVATVLIIFNKIINDALREES